MREAEITVHLFQEMLDRPEKNCIDMSFVFAVEVLRRTR